MFSALVIGECLLWYIGLPILLLCGLRKRDETIPLTIQDTSYIKGMSAWCVMASHFMYYASLQEAAPAWLFHTVGQLGGLGVLMFFFASGYGIHKSYRGELKGRHYILRRLCRIYFPYVAMRAILLVIEYAITGDGEAVSSGLKVAVTMGDWYIKVVMIQYFLYWLICRCRRSWLIPCSILFDVILTALFIYQGRAMGWYNSLWLYTAGVVIVEYEDVLRSFISRHLTLTLGTCAGLFAVFGIGFAFMKGAMWANVLKPIAGIALAVFLYGMFTRFMMKSRVVQWSGSRSMYLYVVHPTVWFWMDGVEPLPRLICSLLLTLVLTELLYQILSRIQLLERVVQSKERSGQLQG